MTIEDIALQMTPGIGVKGAVHLLGIFGDARGIFAAAPEELAMKAALREDIIRNIVHRKGFAAAEKELGYCRRNSISAIASTDPEFPALLREIPDYPHVLYLKGNAAALSARCVAMVGTRACTPYGTQSVVVRDTPSNSYDAVSMLEVGDDVRVIGTKGDYYYVLLDDSSVGCLSTSEAE